MTAYVIFIRDSIKDAEEMATYGQKAGAARGDHAITALAFYGAVETLEGPKVDGAVLLSFPDAAAAHAWYDSPAYQDALQHRLKGADYRVLIVEGL